MPEQPLPDEVSNHVGARAASADKAIATVSTETIKDAAINPALSEDLALALLQRNDLMPDVLDELSRNVSIGKSRKVKLAIIAHPKVPRYVAISLLRQLFTFDLMKVVTTPVSPGDIKAAAEEILIRRLESLSSGERISLARRASGRVAGALLQDREVRVVQTALENPRLTEAIIIQTIMLPASTAFLIRSVCEHPKWSLRRDIRTALLRSDKTPASILEKFAAALPLAQLQDILQTSGLSDEVKAMLLKSHQSSQ
jgi:hypothetical protein